ncbi:MAG: hypothetical protein ACI9UK_001193 [Candidatus Krumholzibacteriia bacterium]|jgi:hypothetical protein
MRGRLNIWLVVALGVCGMSYWFGKDLVKSADMLNNANEVAQAVELSGMSFAESGNDGALHLLVLNGTDQSGLAREFGLLLGRAGCVADKVGNAPHNRYDRSFLVNRQLDSSRIEKLAADLGGLPVLIEFDGRSAADAVLVLGKDADRIRQYLSEREDS